MNKRIDKILKFLKEIEKFKLIARKLYLSDKIRGESDAEHSWHLAMFIILFQKELPKGLNMERMLKLALAHDLVEIYAGDPLSFDKFGQKKKIALERKAAKKLIAQLPKDLGEELRDLIDEFEDLKTPEVKVVKAFDKIQPTLQNLCSDGKGWHEYGVTYAIIDEFTRKHTKHTDFLFELHEKLLDEAKKKKLI